jgi:hypothetical protein
MLHNVSRYVYIYIYSLDSNFFWWINQSCIVPGYRWKATEGVEPMPQALAEVELGSLKNGILLN